MQALWRPSLDRCAPIRAQSSTDVPLGRRSRLGPFALCQSVIGSLYPLPFGLCDSRRTQRRQHDRSDARVGLRQLSQPPNHRGGRWLPRRHVRACPSLRPAASRRPGFAAAAPRRQVVGDEFRPPVHKGRDRDGDRCRLGARSLGNLGDRAAICRSADRNRIGDNSCSESLGQSYHVAPGVRVSAQHLHWTHGLGATGYSRDRFGCIRSDSPGGAAESHGLGRRTAGGSRFDTPGSQGGLANRLCTLRSLHHRFADKLEGPRATALTLGPGRRCQEPSSQTRRSRRDLEPKFPLAQTSR